MKRVALQLGSSILAVAFLMCLLWLIAPRSPADTLTIPYTFTNGTVADATKVNADFTAIANITNGLIDDSNVKNSGITGSTKLVNASVPLAKLAPNSVDSSKIVDSTIVSSDIFDGTVARTDIAAGATYNVALGSDAAETLTNTYTADIGSVSYTVRTVLPRFFFTAKLETSSNAEIMNVSCSLFRNGSATASGDYTITQQGVTGLHGKAVMHFDVFDIPGATGTYTYSVRCKENGAENATTSDATIYAMELLP